MGVKSACATEMGNDCLHRASFLPQIYGKHTATVGAVGFPTVIIDLMPWYQNPTSGPDRSSFLVQISDQLSACLVARRCSEPDPRRDSKWDRDCRRVDVDEYSREDSTEGG
jgi:hypothetical protein